MAFVSLNIPTLVQDIKVEEKPHYYLRPLFIGFPVAIHRRFDFAMSQFQKEIKGFFKGYSVYRQNMDQLLWFMFNPDLNYKQYFFEFNLGNQYVEGNFAVVSFHLQGLIFICLPGIDNYMFIGEPDKSGEVDVAEQAKHTIRKLLRLLKEDEEQDFNPENYYSTKKEFVTNVSVNVNIGFGPFKFEQSNDHWFFSRLTGDTNFDGAVEIEKVGYDLNSLYPSELKRAYYQDELVEKVFQTIFHDDNTPIVLIGPEGVGKHSIIHEVVWRYHQDYFKPGKGKRIQHVWHLDPTRVVSGMSIVGMWQKRFEAVIRFIRQPEDQTSFSDKLLIDNPVALQRIGKSASNSMTLSDVLRPFLEKRHLQLTILASPEEWKVVQEKDRRFSDLFQVIRVQEPDLETATRMVLKQRKALELANDTIITIQAIKQLFTIHRNYYKNKTLPGTIVQLLQQMAVKYRFGIVDVPEVREEFQALSGVEERIFDATYQFEKEEVSKVIAQDLVGQPQAVKSLSDIVHVIKAKLCDPEKPLSSFLFIGPTGVGKTQAAKVLCQYLMGSEDSLIRFDMNEYIDEYAIQRLIGDYYNPEGQLTGKVRYRPFGILLLDEIEKAHPKVHDLLLQVLDDGRLTDSLGRTVDFSNTIIIMTSNVGSREVAGSIGYNTENIDKNAIFRKAVEMEFRPEFINRIDQIVIFDPLELDHILGIARLQIRELLRRDGFVRRTTILNISKDALEWVARRGYNAQMGGRALKRQIERDLTTLSAEQLIKTYSDRPILMDILLEDSRLVPKIKVLEFVEPIEEDWMPQLPELEKGRRFYGQLLRSIEQIERDILYFDGASTDVIIPGQTNINWQSYHFKNRVAEIKDNIRNILLGFSDRYFSEAPAIPLRLKRGDLVPRKDMKTKGVRENFKDRLFQQEALKEITEVYQYSAAQFDSMNTEFINNYLDVALLQLATEGFFKNKTDEINISFHSCITGLGNWEIRFLLEQYTALLDQMDVTYTVSKDKRNIRAEGHSLYKILQGEEGIHLFYAAHQNPLPIQIIVEKVDGSNRLPCGEVIRIYDSNRTLTDLRTGFTNDINITTNEFKLLIYAGIEAGQFKKLRF